MVLVGDFNPRIFHPQWFVDNALIDDGDVNEDSVDVIHPDICQFKTEWCTVVVNKHRFQASSSYAPLVRLLDLVSKLFGEYLVHTPITAFAINHVSTFDLGSVEVMDKLGKALAPQEPWGKWGESFKGESANRGGLIHIEMIQNNLDDRESGFVKAIVKPAEQSGPSCVNVIVNDHFNLVSSKNAETAGREMHGAYERSLDKSNLISKTIVDLAEKFKGADN